MAPITMNVSARLRWWVRPYVAILVAVSRVTGLEPDWIKVTEVLRRGVVVRIGKAKADGNGRQEST
jgi:hypothetical protein